MFRSIVVAGALMLAPGFVAAEEVWRWQDGSGQLHYTNQADLKPADAEPVRTQIRVVPSVAQPSVESAPAPFATRRAGAGRPGRGFGAYSYNEYSGCWGPGPYTYLILNNPHELSDQVKQANMLDALGVQWRNNCH